MKTKRIAALFILIIAVLSLVSCGNAEENAVIECPKTQQEWDALLPEYESVFEGTEITYAVEDIDYFVYAQGADFSQFEEYCSLIEKEYPEVVSEQSEDENVAAHKVMRGLKDKNRAYFEVTVDYEPAATDKSDSTSLVTVQIFYTSW